MKGLGLHLNVLDELRHLGTRVLRAMPCLALPLAFILPVTAAAAYPEKPIRLVVPFPPGGGTDDLARVISAPLSTQMKQQIVIDGRPGAGGAIAAQAVASSPPDGYTLFFATTGTIAINPHLYSRLGYDPFKDFTPIATLASSANILVVHPSLPVKSVKELIALAKKHPGQLTYGSGGVGTSSHLAAALFESMTGTKFLHIPYKGASQTTIDLLAGRLDMMIQSYMVHVEFVKQGKVRALGLSGTKTSPQFPGVPTISAAGVPGYDVSVWFALLGPARMPADIVKKIYSDSAVVLQQPKLIERMSAMGAEPFVKTPEEFARFMRSESAKWADVVQKSGAKLD